MLYISLKCFIIKLRYFRKRKERLNNSLKVTQLERDLKRLDLNSVHFDPRDIILTTHSMSLLIY